MSSTKNKVFLTGATGDIGTQLLAILQKAHHPVRVLCRRQDQHDSFTSRKIEASLGTLDDSAASLAKLMTGCDTLFLNTAPNPNMEAQLINAIDAAILAGIKYIIKISAGDRRLGTNVHWAGSHYITDRYFKAKMGEVGNVKWTIVLPSGFMQNILYAKDAIQKGFLPQTAGKGKGGWLDSADIAAVGAQICLDGPEKHHSQEYFLTGSTLINFDDITAGLSRTIGHKVRYIDLPPWIFGLLLKYGGGMDEYMVSGLLAQFNDILRPGLEGVPANNVIEEITGRRPITIEQFAEKHIKEFEGFDAGPYLLAALVGILGIAGLVVSRFV